jgi:hypothetical protein
MMQHGTNSSTSPTATFADLTVAWDERGLLALIIIAQRRLSNVTWQPLQ